MPPPTAASAAAVTLRPYFQLPYCYRRQCHHTRPTCGSQNHAHWNTKRPGCCCTCTHMGTVRLWPGSKTKPAPPIWNTVAAAAAVAPSAWLPEIPVPDAAAAAAPSCTNGMLCVCGMCCCCSPADAAALLPSDVAGRLLLLLPAAAAARAVNAAPLDWWRRCIAALLRAGVMTSCPPTAQQYKVQQAINMSS